MLRDVLDGKANFSMRTADILFAVVIALRASALLFSTIAMRGLGPYNVLAVRFLLAFIILFAVFHKKFFTLKKETLLHGLAIGTSFFICMAFEMFALKYTTSSKTAFLENMAMIFVPLLEALLTRRAPHFAAIISALVALVGVGLLTLGDSGNMTISKGEILGILAAFGFAVTVIVTDRFSKKDDSFMLGILQVGVIGILSLIASCIFETPHLPTSGEQWGAILYLAIVASCIGFVLQPVAQSCTTSEHTSLISSLNPLIAALLGAIFLGDRMGVLGVIGAILIFSAVILQNVLETKAKNRQLNTASQ